MEESDGRMKDAESGVRHLLEPPLLNVSSRQNRRYQHGDTPLAHTLKFNCKGIYPVAHHANGIVSSTSAFHALIPPLISPTHAFPSSGYSSLIISAATWESLPTLQTT